MSFNPRVDYTNIRVETMVIYARDYDTNNDYRDAIDDIIGRYGKWTGWTVSAEHYRSGARFTILHKIVVEA